MADTTNLSQFLSDVADAIRTKKETTEQIPAENFDQEILSIETGIDTSDATATSSDILSPKTAYVKEQKVTGAMIPTISVSGLSQYDPLVVLKTSQNNQYDAFEYLGILAITTRYNNNVSISLYNKEDLSEISTYTFDRATYFGNGTYLVTNIVEATNEYFEMSIGMGYGNGGGNTLYTFKKVRYTYETNSWLIYGTINYNHGEYFNNSGQTSGLRADGKPNVYYLCNDKDPTDGKNTCINIVYLNWGNGDVSGSYTEVHRDSVQRRNHSWIETTGDGSWIRMTGCLVKANINGRTLNSWVVNNVYFSHNMKYMVQGTNIYKITPGNDYNTINSNKELFSTLPSYDKVFFSIDDYYLLHYYGGVLSVYQIENNGLTRVQQISLPNCQIKEIFNNTLILAYNTSTYSIGILKCNIGGVTIEKIERNGQIFQYVRDSNIPNTSEVLNKKPFYGIDSVLYGTMPNNGELNYTPSTEEQIIPAGYTSGGSISAVDITTLEDYKNCEKLSSMILGNNDTKPYTKLEYIGFTGTQYIEPILLNSNYRIEFYISVDSSSLYRNLFDNNTAPPMLWITDSSQVELNERYRYTIQTNTPIHIINDSTQNDSKLYINNVLMGTAPKISGREYPVTMFNRNGAQCFKGKVYYVKVYKKDTLEKELIPVKDTNNVACLFDTISRTYYYNIGTGTFTEGGIV